jgi:hypothetical protein
MEKCDQVVMDFLTATDIRMFLPKIPQEPRQEMHGHEENERKVPGKEMPRQKQHQQTVPGAESRCLDWRWSLTYNVDHCALSFFLFMCTWFVSLCHRERWVADGSTAILPTRPEAERVF